MMFKRVRPRAWWVKGLIAAAMVVAALWVMGDREFDLPRIFGPVVKVVCRVETGAVGVYWFDPSRLCEAFSGDPLRETRGSFGSARWWPEVRGNAVCRLVMVPVWALVLPVVVAWGVWLLRRRIGDRQAAARLAMGYVARLAVLTAVVAAVPWDGAAGVVKVRGLTVVGLNVDGVVGWAWMRSEELAESLKFAAEGVVTDGKHWRWWGVGGTDTSSPFMTFRVVGMRTGLWAGVLGVPAAILAWRTRRTVDGGNHCERCGYDLSGQASGGCPECGRGRGASV